MTTNIPASIKNPWKYKGVRRPMWSPMNPPMTGPMLCAARMLSSCKLKNLARLSGLEMSLRNTETPVVDMVDPIPETIRQPTNHV